MKIPSTPVLFAVLVACAAVDGGDAESSGQPAVLIDMGADTSACFRKKTLHLIRHAQGEHNEHEEAGHQPETPRQRELLDRVGIAWVLLEEVSGLRYWDPPLTPKGWDQASERRRQLETETPHFHIDAVVSSPFRRTLQTAYGVIPHLNASLDRQHHKIKLLATDLLRESIHNFTCDGRSRVSQLRREFPTGTSQGRICRLAHPVFFDWSHANSLAPKLPKSRIHRFDSSHRIGRSRPICHTRFVPMYHTPCLLPPPPHANSLSPPHFTHSGL